MHAQFVMYNIPFISVKVINRFFPISLVLILITPGQTLLKGYGILPFGLLRLPGFQQWLRQEEYSG